MTHCLGTEEKFSASLASGFDLVEKRSTALSAGLHPRLLPSASPDCGSESPDGGSHTEQETDAKDYPRRGTTRHFRAISMPVSLMATSCRTDIRVNGYLPLV